MADPVIDETILLYGFALFFIFFVLMIMVIRYSNRELVKKFSNIYDKLNLSERDLRKLAETQMRSKNDLKKEIVLLRNEIESLKSTGTAKKSIARTR